MGQVIRDDDLRIDIGRATGGRTFIRVVHEPTGINRQLVGLGNRSYHDVVNELRSAIESELVQHGWTYQA
jgi:hypothetical protein